MCGNETGVRLRENALGEMVLSLNCPVCGSLSTSRDGGLHWFTWSQKNGEKGESSSEGSC